MDASGELRAPAKRLTADGPVAADEAQRLRAAVDRLTADLERSQARFRDIIDRNADAIIVIDRGGVVRFANRMATTLFGAERGSLGLVIALQVVSVRQFLIGAPTEFGVVVAQHGDEGIIGP